MPELRNVDDSEMTAYEKTALIRDKITKYFKNQRQQDRKARDNVEPNTMVVSTATRNRRRARKHYVSTNNAFAVIRLLPFFCSIETGAQK